MVSGGDYVFKPDVVSLRLTALAKSEAFRTRVLERLANGENPFKMRDLDLNGINIRIVDDEMDAFAAKLNELVGLGEGPAYTAEANALEGPGVLDNEYNRKHIWDYWEKREEADDTLWPKKQELDEAYLSQGPTIYTGEYSLAAGSQPDVQGINASRTIMFRNTAQVMFKLEGVTPPVPDS
jgi:hypothetical protein